MRDKSSELPIRRAHRQIVLDAETLGLMVRAAWLRLPEQRGEPFRITLHYLEPGEAWDALRLGAEHFADEGSQELLIEARLMTGTEISNDMRYWNQRLRAIRRAPQSKPITKYLSLRIEPRHESWKAEAASLTTFSLF